MENADQEDIRAALDSLQASVAGLAVASGALIQTHPQYLQMQLAMTALLEQQLGSCALATGLTERQKEQVCANWWSGLVPSAHRSVDGAGRGHLRGRKRSFSVLIARRKISSEPDRGCWRPTCALLSRQ
jgi:hypothetical protein